MKRQIVWFLMFALLFSRLAYGGSNDVHFSSPGGGSAEAQDLDDVAELGGSTDVAIDITATKRYNNSLNSYWSSFSGSGFV